MLRCPICHSLLSLEALVQEDMGRALFALVLKQKQALQGSLVNYLGLFRSKQRDLSNDRALRLAQEVVALADEDTLAMALSKVVESMRVKQAAQGADWKPLKNHNYLKEVIKGCASEQKMTVNAPVNAAAQQYGQQQSKAAWGLNSLEKLKEEYE